MTENAGFPVREKRGNYKLYERIYTKQRIRQMIVDGHTYESHTYESIMRELGISERTPQYNLLVVVVIVESLYLCGISLHITLASFVVLPTEV